MPNEGQDPGESKSPSAPPTLAKPAPEVKANNADSGLDLTVALGVSTPHLAAPRGFLIVTKNVLGAPQDGTGLATTVADRLPFPSVGAEGVSGTREIALGATYRVGKIGGAEVSVGNHVRLSEDHSESWKQSGRTEGMVTVQIGFW